MIWKKICSSLIKNSKKCVLYTEGKTDKKHILRAIKALKMVEDFKDIFIFGCTWGSSCTNVYGNAYKSRKANCFI